jgi:hypothetical protein
LLHCGFAEPVIDVERHQIRYASAAAMQTELEQLLEGSATGAIDSLTLNFELIVAAAFAAEADADPGAGRAADEVAVAVDSIRRRRR